MTDGIYSYAGVYVSREKQRFSFMEAEGEGGKLSEANSSSGSTIVVRLIKYNRADESSRRAHLRVIARVQRPHRLHSKRINGVLYIE